MREIRLGYRHLIRIAMASKHDASLRVVVEVPHSDLIQNSCAICAMLVPVRWPNSIVVACYACALGRGVGGMFGSEGLSLVRAMCPVMVKTGRLAAGKKASPLGGLGRQVAEAKTPGMAQWRFGRISRESALGGTSPWTDSKLFRRGQVSSVSLGGCG